MYAISELLIIPTGVFESKLMEMTDPEARKAYLDETKCTSVLDKIIVQVKGSRKYLEYPLLKVSYRALNLSESFFVNNASYR
jgi:hypothetical protein